LSIFKTFYYRASCKTLKIADFFYQINILYLKIADSIVKYFYQTKEKKGISNEFIIAHLAKNASKSFSLS